MNFEELIATLDLGGLLLAGTILAVTWLLARGLRGLTSRLGRAVPSHRLTVEQASALLRFFVQKWASRK